MGNVENKPTEAATANTTVQRGSKDTNEDIPYTFYSVSKPNDNVPQSPSVDRITVVREAEVFKPQVDPDIAKLQEIPEFLPFIKASARGKVWDVEYQLDIINQRSLMIFCANYRDVFDKFTTMASKQQKDINNKIRNIEGTAGKALKLVKNKKNGNYKI